MMAALITGVIPPVSRDVDASRLIEDSASITALATGAPRGEGGGRRAGGAPAPRGGWGPGGGGGGGGGGPAGSRRGGGPTPPGGAPPARGWAPACWRARQGPPPSRPGSWGSRHRATPAG